MTPLTSLFFKILCESTSEESSGEDDEQGNKRKDGLLDLEDLGPMMNTMKKAKVKFQLLLFGRGWKFYLLTSDDERHVNCKVKVSFVLFCIVTFIFF